MFELFDEPARRTLFFARYEASRLGIRSIETEHLLLGLMREPRGVTRRLLFALPLADVRKELESTRTDEKIATSVEIPFSAGAKHVLHHASDEATRLSHSHVGPEHLLLGLLRETESFAATILARHGMRLEDTRQQVRELSTYAADTPLPKSVVQALLDQVIESARQLQMSLSAHPEAVMQVDMLLTELESLKALLNEQQ
jgi:ATP-dependent Clp protease ATP-binding subunit ClpC